MQEERIYDQDMPGLVEGARYAPDERVCEIHGRSTSENEVIPAAVEFTSQE